MSDVCLRGRAVLLERGDLQRTLRRIAHEIVERKRRSTSWRWSASTRAASPSPSGCATLIERVRRRRGADRRARHHLLPRRHGRARGEQRAHPQPVVKATRLDFPLDGASRSCWSTTCSTRGARSAPRSTRCSTTAARARPARGPGRPRAPRAADPRRLRRQEPADRARRARQRAAGRGRRRRPGRARDRGVVSTVELTRRSSP